MICEANTIECMCWLREWIPFIFMYVWVGGTSH